tara:strand:- start:239 stop:724 length:486 start_codon:yes stop_codon:yes gene_type:complete
MPIDKEKKNEYNRLYRIANKEKIKEQRRLYNVANKEKKREYARLHYQANNEKLNEQCRLYRKENIEKIKEQQKAYRQTPQGKKNDMMKSWRNRGIINVTDTMYDRYINTHCCDVCKNEFKNSRDRCLDHDHTTGDFRQVLCRACNNQDSWKKKIYDAETAV